MKLKKLLFLLICLQMAGNAFTQDVVKRTHLGISATPLLSKPVLDTEASKEVTSAFSWNVGGDFYFDFSDKSQLKAGLLLQNTSISYQDFSPNYFEVIDGEVVPVVAYWDARYSDLSAGIPVEINYRVGQKSEINHLFLLGGTQFQYRINTSGEINFISKDQLISNYKPDEFPFEAGKFRIALIVGIGYEFLLGHGKCMISPVYEYGLTKLYTVESSAVANGNVTAFGIRLAYY